MTPGPGSCRGEGRPLAGCRVKPRGRIAGGILGILLSAAATSPVEAQLQLSAVNGRVLDGGGAPVQHALVALSDPLGQAIATTTSDDQGRFALPSLAPGVYHLAAQVPPLSSPTLRITVRSGLPLEVELRLSPHMSESVAVEGDAAGEGGQAGTTLAGEAVRRGPAASRRNALRAAVATTPGWTSEDSGLIHFRGSDDGLLLVLDGVPVYERLDPRFAVGLDPLTIQSVRVLTGFVPPEFGLRSGGVVEVRSLGGSLQSWSGLLDSGVGTYESQSLSGVAQGPLGPNASITVGLGGERSSRFLGPVSPDNLHNHGSTGGGEAELVWAPGPNVVTLRGGYGRSSLDVPNAQPQQEAGQDQRQALGQGFATLGWQRAWSRSTASQLALFGRFVDGRLTGSPADTPLFAEGDRKQDRRGALAAVTHERGRHRVKVGVEASQVRLHEQFGFFVTDLEAGAQEGLSDAALALGPDHPFAFEDGVRRPILSFYAQDSWRPSDRWTLALGVRYDRSRLLLDESQWSPRLGVSYELGWATLRASLNRFFQPPQSEYLLLSSSPQARGLSPFEQELGTGGAEVRAERQTACELGAEFWLGRSLRADLAVWKRAIRNQGDPNVFYGTTVVFPNAVDRGDARGLDLRLEVPRRSGFAGFLTYTLARIEQTGPDQRRALPGRRHHRDRRRNPVRPRPRPAPCPIRPGQLREPAPRPVGRPRRPLPQRDAD